MAGENRQSEPQSRYVIQHHVGQARDHYDLMIERGRTLWTWQIDQPLAALSAPADAVRIADHRPTYLTYEGPIHDGSLGSCRITDRGHVRWIECSDDSIMIELIGGTAAGQWLLRRGPGQCDQWRIERV